MSKAQTGSMQRASTTNAALTHLVHTIPIDTRCITLALSLTPNKHTARGEDGNLLESCGGSSRRILGCGGWVSWLVMIARCDDGWLDRCCLAKQCQHGFET